jgi:hypothetical protein
VGEVGCYGEFATAGVQRRAAVDVGQAIELVEPTCCPAVRGDENKSVTSSSAKEADVGL